MGEYDDLMKAAKQKLEFEKTGTINDEEAPKEDIYASIRDSSDIQDDDKSNRKPENINPDYEAFNNKPDIYEEDINYQKDDNYYIDPNDEPVFEGGPGVSKVQLWKKQYGITRIFHTKILEKHYMFRTLNRAEYEQIASLSLDSLTNEELICKTCVLWPLNYNYATIGREEAGFPSTLAQIIMENSGFTSEYGIEVL